MAIPPAAHEPTPQFHIWPSVKMYCHEGARDLQVRVYVCVYMCVCVYVCVCACAYHGARDL
jgi:hypothetical protein